MNLLELFAGSRSIGKVGKELKYNVFSSDIHQFGKIDYIIDILDFDYTKVPFIPDIIWASPPCTGFSVASIGHHWTGGSKAYIPKTDTAKLGIKLVKKTLEIIEYFKKLNPNLIWYIENPRGILRKMDFMQELDRTTVTYCQYGCARMKPTDIWSNNIYSITNKDGWKPKPMCKNGDSCHISAPRGSRTGTQGFKNKFERGKIPSKLCRDVLRSVK